MDLEDIRMVKSTQLSMTTDRGYNGTRFLYNIGEDLVAFDEKTKHIEDINNFCNFYKDEVKKIKSKLKLKVEWNELLNVLYTRKMDNYNSREGLVVYYIDPTSADIINSNIGKTYITGIDTIIVKLNEKICKSTKYKDITINDLIIITPTSVTNDFMSTIKERRSYRITLFQFDELYMKATDHILASNKIRKLNPQEKREFLDEVGTTHANMPHMYSGDPVAKYYGLRPGDIIEVNRVNIGLKTFIRRYPHYATIIYGTPI